MITGIQSLSTKRFGVSKADRIIIPMEYITPPVFQINGITMQDSDYSWSAFTNDGRLIVKNCKNVLFLSNNLMLFSNGLDNTCNIFNYVENRLLFNIPFNALLFFCGSNQQAIPFTSETNVEQLLKTTDYYTHSAHLEDLICAKIASGWGVINSCDGSIFEPFKNRVMVQFTGNRICVPDPTTNEPKLI